MIPRQVQAIFFDAVGTLIHPDPPAAAVYAEVGRRFGSRYPIEEIMRRFAAAFNQEEAADRAGGLRTSEQRERRRWQHIVARVLDDVTDAGACFAELYEHFSRPRAWRCEDEAASVIQQLAGRGYVLGLASNYDRRLRSLAAGLPGLCRLEHLVISSEVGWRKPAAEFFAALCRCAGLPASQILYVGDDPDNDYEGATAAGLQAVIFDPQGKQLEFSGHRLQRLAEMLEI